MKNEVTEDQIFAALKEEYTDSTEQEIRTNLATILNCDRGTVLMSHDPYGTRGVFCPAAADPFLRTRPKQNRLHHFYR